ncbi:MAG: B12-binding domain-containing protein [Labilithrix sp.]
MILWCAYCQTFLREEPPYDDPLISHGICATCAQRFQDDDGLVDRTEELRDLMTRIFDCARRAEMTAIPALIEEARVRGVTPASLLIGFLQPALYRIGQAWHAGSVTVAEEHRFTAWCETFLAQLPARRSATSQVDVLILVLPSNAHTLGARFAAELLEARGISTQVIVPGIPTTDAVKEVERLRPAIVGLSCALPSSLPEADALVAQLRELIDPSWQGRFLLAGMALRDADASWTSKAGASVAITLDDVERELTATRRALSGVDVGPLALG